jgi:hypothetical protein
MAVDLVGAELWMACREGRNEPWARSQWRSEPTSAFADGEQLGPMQGLQMCQVHAMGRIGSETNPDPPWGTDERAEERAPPRLGSCCPPPLGRTGPLSEAGEHSLLQLEPSE